MVVEVLLNFLQLGFGGGIVFSDFLYAIARCVVVFLVSRSPFELIDRGKSVVGFGHYSEISGYHQSFVHETAVVSAVINEIPSEKIGKLIGCACRSIAIEQTVYLVCKHIAYARSLGTGPAFLINKRRKIHELCVVDERG